LKYNIIATADYHWGAMDADKQLQESQFILDYITNNKIDLFVICGDYFDHRLLVNSKSAINAMAFMQALINISQDKKFNIVIMQGTESHDYDQLEIFRSFESESFKIIKETSVDESLPGLQCLYAPDENLISDEYYIKYMDILNRDDLDIMFFHGTFDINAIGRNLKDQVPNVLFDYSFFNQKTKLMVGGHWHNGDCYGNMYYTRSPYRWKFEEDLPKGFIHIEYNTSSKKYKLNRIENINASTYYTFYVDTSLYTDINQYSTLLSDVKKMLSDNIDHIRIKITITDDKELNNSCIDNLINEFQNSKQVKVVTENKYAKQIRKNHIDENNEYLDKFKYIFDGNNSISTIYKKFIYDTKGIDIPLEEIEYIINDMHLE
jgi:DNA repair exonuclease SbcCD nuclease subunit